MYFCLRNGLHSVALCAARSASDSVLDELGGLSVVLDAWLGNDQRISDQHTLRLIRQGERLVKDLESLKTELCHPYKVLLCGLLSGASHVLEMLRAAENALAMKPVLSTMEDYMWSKLCMSARQVGVLDAEWGGRSLMCTRREGGSRMRDKHTCTAGKGGGRLIGRHT